jgi:hypothetical protein
VPTPEAKSTEAEAVYGEQFLRVIFYERQFFVRRFGSE